MARDERVHGTAVPRLLPAARKLLLVTGLKQFIALDGGGIGAEEGERWGSGRDSHGTIPRDFVALHLSLPHTKPASGL